MFIKRLLKKIGFKNIVLAEDGESALHEIKKKSFDLILSDWQMQVMNGLEFFQVGFDQYMVKPLNLDNLGEKVE